MLGENHSLINDFPELQDVIIELLKSDDTFSQDNERYNVLDTEIRNLELEDSPIHDDAMHNLKHERSALKDSLYKRLVQNK